MKVKEKHLVGSLLVPSYFFFVAWQEHCVEYDHAVFRTCLYVSGPSISGLVSPHVGSDVDVLRSIE